MAKIIKRDMMDVGRDLLEKAKPIAESAVEKTVETVDQLREMINNVSEKIATKGSEIIKFGKSSYDSIIENVGANSELVIETEKETGTSKKLNDIWQRIAILTKNKLLEIKSLIVDGYVVVGGKEIAQEKYAPEQPHKPAESTSEFVKRFERELAEERRQKGTSRETKKENRMNIDEAFDKEALLAQEGKWKAAKSRFFGSGKWTDNGDEKYKALEEINNAKIEEDKKKKVDEVFDKEAVLSQEGKWQDVKSSFFVDRMRSKDSDEKYKALEEVNSLKIDEIFEEERREAEKGEWSEKGSMFSNYGKDGNIIIGKGNADVSKIFKLDEIQRNSLKRIAEEKRKKEAFDKEISEAESGKWRETFSFFNKLSKNKDDEEQIERLRGINSEAQRKQKEEEARKKTEEENRKKEEQKRKQKEEAAKKKSQEERRRNDEQRKSTERMSSVSDEDYTMQFFNLNQRNLDQSSLKKLYRAFALKNHPDKLKNQDISDNDKKSREELFKKITSGYTSLLKKNKK